MLTGDCRKYNKQEEEVSRTESGIERNKPGFKLCADVAKDPAVQSL